MGDETEKLIEEVAKAMYEEMHGQGEWNYREPVEEDLYRRRARAALAVLEKRTDATSEHPVVTPELSEAASRVALSEFYWTRPGRTQLDAMRDAINQALAVSRDEARTNIPQKESK